MPTASRVQETTNVTDTSTITLSGAVAGSRSFATAIASTDNDLAVGLSGVGICITDSLGNFEDGYYKIGGTAQAPILIRESIEASSNNGNPVSFPAGTKNVFNAVLGSDLRRMPRDRDLAFSQAVPLDRVGTVWMAQQTVSGAIAFSTSGLVRGASAYARLLADGVNMPTFSGMKEHSGSVPYDNRSGILNVIMFMCDGTDVFYAVGQQLAAIPVVSAVTMTGPTAGSAGSASSNFTVALSPVGGTLASSVTVTPTPVSGVTFNPSSAVLSMGSPSATFTAKASAAGSYQIAVTNNGQLSNPSAITYVASAASNFLRMSNPTSQTESGTGPYTYTGTGGGFFSGPGEGVCTKAFQAGADGYVTMKMLTAAAFGGNETFFGLDASSTPVGLTSIDYGVVGHTDAYSPFTSGNNGTNSTTVGAVNDYVRFKRTGTVLYADVSKDSGATWTNVQTWTGVTTGVMYIHAITANAGSYTLVDSGNLA